MLATDGIARLLAFACFLGLMGTVTPATKLGTNCLAKSPDLNECVKNIAQGIFNNMHLGFKEVGVPVMDPLQVVKMDIINGQGSVVLNLELFNTSHTGLSKVTVDKVVADPEKYSLDMYITVPNYNIEGLYKAKGKIIVLPIQGEGNSYFRFFGIKGVWKIKGEPKVKNGKTHMKITKFDVEIVPKDLKMRLDNLFNGNKELGEQMNNFLNQNWEEVYTQLKPIIEDSFSQIMQSFGNRALDKIPYNQIFHDIS
ncbi:hypothetical protein LSTR_LSTR012324 [Laodelphax striatellus]|uniref:Uncharacterized protein n=1 Tax=Laodelphax striatellus TaxID=195883 RepID=A0A482WSQ3_LAOST|nr:hypothetical protein LSTR_LSTR012324 [Laodelphax striatellus]